MKSFNYFFEFDEDLNVQKKNVMGAVRRCVSSYKDFLSNLEVKPEEGEENYVSAVKMRAVSLVDFSITIFAIALNCGVYAQSLSAKRHIAAGPIGENAPSKNMLISHYFEPDVDTLAPQYQQEKSVEVLVEDLFKLSACFYYVSEVATGVDKNYSKEMENFFEFLYCAAMQLSGGVVQLGSEDIDEVLGNFSNVGVLDKRMFGFWGGRFLTTKQGGYYQARVNGMIDKLLNC